MLETQTMPDIVEEVSEINAADLEHFLIGKVTLGDAAKIHKVDQTLVHDRCYRVNVWTKSMMADSVVPSFRIANSFYLEISSNGEIIDQTIRKGSV